MDQPLVDHRTRTVHEVCAALRITRRTAVGLSGRGDLAAFNVGQGWRVDARDLDAFIERQKRAAVQGREKGNAAWAG